MINGIPDGAGDSAGDSAGDGAEYTGSLVTGGLGGNASGLITQGLLIQPSEAFKATVPVDKAEDFKEFCKSNGIEISPAE